MPQASSGSYTVTYPVHLPAGYGPATGLASDVDGGGAWYFAQGGSPTDPLETLFHWARATDTTTSYPIDVPAGGMTPVAASETGTAWVGIGSTLVKVEPAADVGSAVQDISLPEVSVGAPGSGLPQVPPGTPAPIDALLSISGNDLIVGRAFATEVQVVDQSTDAVSDIALPGGYALAGLGSGDLTAGTNPAGFDAALYGSDGQHVVGQYSGGAWQVADGPCPTYAGSSSPAGLVVRGPGCVAQQAAGSAAPSELASDLDGTPGCALAMTETDTLVCTKSGAEVLDSSSGAVVGNVSFGSAPSGPAIGGGRQGADQPTSRTIEPTDVVSGGNGLAYFLPDSGDAALGLLTSQQSSEASSDAKS